LLQPRFVRFAALFKLAQDDAARLPGLLILRSLVRIQPGPCDLQGNYARGRRRARMSARTCSPASAPASAARFRPLRLAAACPRGFRVPFAWPSTMTASRSSRDPSMVVDPCRRGHLLAYLVQTSDGPIPQLCDGSRGPKGSRRFSVVASSIDAERRDVMRQVLGAAVPAERL
jgi:hypothetical protein